MPGRRGGGRAGTAVCYACTHGEEVDAEDACELGGARHQLHLVHHLQRQLQPLQIVLQHAHRAAVALRVAAARRAARAARTTARRGERCVQAAVPPAGEVAVGEVGEADAEKPVGHVLQW